MSTDPTVNFPKALKYYMGANGKKQQDLIDDLKISSATVSQWVNGKAFPRMDRIELLATYFNITVTDLLTDPYDKPKLSANPLMMAKLLESTPSLYELFNVVLTLQEDDINLLKSVATRLSQLQENHLEELQSSSVCI